MVVDMYAALELHTEETLQAGEDAVIHYDPLLKVFILFISK